MKSWFVTTIIYVLGFLVGAAWYLVIRDLIGEGIARRHYAKWKAKNSNIPTERKRS